MGYLLSSETLRTTPIVVKGPHDLVPHFENRRSAAIDRLMKEKMKHEKPFRRKLLQDPEEVYGLLCPLRRVIEVFRILLAIHCIFHTTANSRLTQSRRESTTPRNIFVKMAKQSKTKKAKKKSSLRIHRLLRFVERMQKRTPSENDFSKKRQARRGRTFYLLLR